MPAVVTIETAPRDAQGLMALGRFQHRNLATALGLMDTEEKKGAFMQLSNEDMVAEVLAGLQRHDAAAKGVKNQPAADKPPRTPVTTEKPAAPAAANKPAGLPPNNANASAPGLVQLVEAITNLNTTTADLKTTLLSKLEALEGAAAHQQEITRGTNRLLLLGLSLNLTLAEEVLKAGRNDVIEAAHSDILGIISTLSALDPRLDAATSEEEEGEEEEEEEEGAAQEGNA